MKILIAFYSRTGLTRKLAGKLASDLNADLEEIIDKDKRQGVLGYLRSGREAMGERPASIEPVKIDPTDYDLVIVGTPVWAYNMSCPVRTYLTENKGRIKKLACLITLGGQGAEKTISKMSELTGLESVANLVVLSREIASNDYQFKIDAFSKELSSTSFAASVN